MKHKIIQQQNSEIERKKLSEVDNIANAEVNQKFSNS